MTQILRLRSGQIFTNLLLLGLWLIPSAQGQIGFELLGLGVDKPVDISFAPGDSRLYVTGQRGKVYIMDTLGNLEPKPFLDISDRVDQNLGERGLLGLTFHPDYVSNGYFYVNYYDTNTFISRFTRDGIDHADSLSEFIIKQIYQPYTNHNAGDLNFGPDGYLYFGLGDGGAGGDPQNRAQNPDSILGKMVRIDVDGGSPYVIPPGNPFAGNPDTLPEIWALGLRNPWRFSFDKLTGDMWIADVGETQFEEINYVPVSAGNGMNFGWRCYEAESTFDTSIGCFSQSNYYSPLAWYAHSQGCSITGGYVYRGSEMPEVYGKYICGDYCTGNLVIADTAGNLTILPPVGENISSFGEDHEGNLYFAALNSGKIYRLVHSGVGLNESQNISFSVYPNPFQDYIIINSDGIATGDATWNIYSMDGKIILTGNIDSPKNWISLTSLQTGAYIIELRNGNTIYRKIIFRK